jgi:hypothetical protein
MIQRWDQYDHGGSVESPDGTGDWCKWEDVKSLQAERDEYAELAGALLAECDGLQDENASFRAVGVALEKQVGILQSERNQLVEDNRALQLRLDRVVDAGVARGVENAALNAEVVALQKESDGLHRMFDAEHEKLIKAERRNKLLKAEVKRLRKELEPSPQTKALLESMEKAAEENRKNTPGIRRRK